MWSAFFFLNAGKVDYMLRPVALVGEGMERHADGTVTRLLSCDHRVRRRDEAVLWLAEKCGRLSTSCVTAARQASTSVYLGGDDGQHLMHAYVDDRDLTCQCLIDRVATFAGPTGELLARRENGTIDRVGFRTVYGSRREAAVAGIRRLTEIHRSAMDAVKSLERPAFALGRVVGTPGALRAAALDEVREMLGRHEACDWGDVCDEDWDANDLAVEAGERLLSSYGSARVITEADRSTTTVMLPEEY